MQSVEEHLEIPQEETVVTPVGEPRKRRRVRKRKEGTRGTCESRRKLTVAGRKVSRRATVAWRERNLVRKIWIQDNCEPWKRWTITGRNTTSRATVAWRSENVVRKNWIRNQAKRGTPKRRKDGERLWKCLEYSNGIRSRGVEEHIHLRKGRKTAKNIGGRRGHQQQLKSMGNGNKVYSKTIRLDIAKRTFRSTAEMQKMKEWTLWRGRPPPKRKKRVVYGVRAGQMWEHRQLQELQPTLLCVCVREREINKKTFWIIWIT
jgi:hypothetical protein